MMCDANTATVAIECSPDLKWTAVRTKSRCEKMVAEYCRRYDLTCYLPLRRRAQRYQRRTVVTFIPMFPGYVFAQLSPEARLLLTQGPKTVAVLPVSDFQESNLVRELQGIQRLEQAELEAELVVQPDLVPGKSVLIIGGPLKGLNGVVDHRKDKARVTMNVEMLGQSVYVELDVGEVVTSED